MKRDGGFVMTDDFRFVYIDKYVFAVDNISLINFTGASKDYVSRTVEIVLKTNESITISDPDEINMLVKAFVPYRKQSLFIETEENNKK